MQYAHTTSSHTFARKSVQSYYFFLKYARVFAKKCKLFNEYDVLVITWSQILR